MSGTRAGRPVIAAAAVIAVGIVGAVVLRTPSIEDRSAIAPPTKPGPPPRDPEPCNEDPTLVPDPSNRLPPTTEALAEGAPAPDAPKAVTRSYREWLLRIQDMDSACAAFGGLGPGWGPRQPGLDRLRDVFGQWLEVLGDGPHPWKGPALLAKANVEHAVGEKQAALDLFIEALLAMDREGPQPPWGVPRLYHFADAPNTAPASEEDRRQWREAHNVRSGGWAFMGGSPLILYGEEGRDFGKWLVTIANDGRTEAAAAASIWLHAVEASNWEVAGFTPPTAVELLLRRRPGGELSPRGSNLWWQGFYLALEEAVRDEDPVALDLQSERLRMSKWTEREREAQRPRELRDRSECVWSLRHEMRTRFADLDTPRGKALRALAERLVAWD